MHIVSHLAVWRNRAPLASARRVNGKRDLVGRRKTYAPDVAAETVWVPLTTSDCFSPLVLTRSMPESQSGALSTMPFLFPPFGDLRVNIGHAFRNVDALRAMRHAASTADAVLGLAEIRNRTVVVRQEPTAA